jgi:hypothetical protein
LKKELHRQTIRDLGWCPGSKVTPEIIELGKLEKGEHSITISIPEAQETTEEFFNFWNISAYIIY